MIDRNKEIKLMYIPYADYKTVELDMDIGSIVLIKNNKRVRIGITDDGKIEIMGHGQISIFPRASNLIYVDWLIE